MRAMILAAGRGERMGEMTARIPKPLLKVNDCYLIEYAIYNIKRAGISEIVINVAHLGEQIIAAIGDGQRYGLKITYSIEAQRLETGGGIRRALPLLGSESFIVVSADVITDFPLASLRLRPPAAAHLVLVRNPVYHAFGDFGLQEDGYLNMDCKPKYTFANVGLYQPGVFSACDEGFFPWTRVMFPKIHAGEVTGELYEGLWYNIGTPQDLEEAQAALADVSLLV